MLVKRFWTCTHLSSTVFFPVTQAVRSKGRHFRTFLHILASPGYAPGTIAVNFTWIEREFNAGQSPRSMYPSIFNRFPVIKAVKSKVRNFSTFLHVLASPGYAPGTIAVSVTWIEREFNACQSPCSMYPSSFNYFWDIARYRWRETGFWQFSWANERFLTTFWT